MRRLRPGKVSVLAFKELIMALLIEAAMRGLGIHGFPAMLNLSRYMEKKSTPSFSSP
jgi:hypothetical protein